jgi:hypothetical protein
MLGSATLAMEASRTLTMSAIQTPRTAQYRRGIGNPDHSGVWRVFTGYRQCRIEGD